jgi:hypothetical protein
VLSWKLVLPSRILVRKRVRFNKLILGVYRAEVKEQLMGASDAGSQSSSEKKQRQQKASV